MGSGVHVSTEWVEPDRRDDIRLTATAPVLESTRDQYLVQLYLAGSTEDRRNDLSIRIRAGDIGIFDLSRPFCTIGDPGTSVSLMLPRGPLERANKGKSLHGIVMASERPLTRILADFILGACKVAPELSDAEAIAVEESLLSLLVMGLAPWRCDTSTDSEALTQTLRQQALEFIEANLYERTLGPALLMQRYQISRAHLYRIFAGIGGIAKIIRDKRLDAAYREITGGSKIRGRSITEVALRLGFSNSSQFTRAFHRRFVMTPSEARQDAPRFRHLARSMPGLQDHFARYTGSTI